MFEIFYIMAIIKGEVEWINIQKMSLVRLLEFSNSAICIIVVGSFHVWHRGFVNKTLIYWKWRNTLYILCSGLNFNLKYDHFQIWRHKKIWKRKFAARRSKGDRNLHFPLLVNHPHSHSFFRCNVREDIMSG